MPEIDRTRKVNGVFFINAIKPKETDSGISLIVSDGIIRREAIIQSDSKIVKKFENECFREIDGYINDDEQLVVESMRPVNYATLDLRKYFLYEEIPINVLSEWLINTACNLKNNKLELICLTVAKQFLAYINEAPISECSYSERYIGCITAFEKISKYQDMILHCTFESEILIAGLFIANLVDSLLKKTLHITNDTLFLKMLSDYVEYYGSLNDVDAETLKKLQTAVCCFYSETEEKLTEKIVDDSFFDKEGDSNL